MLYFGIGPDAPEGDPVLVEGNQILIRQRALRNIDGHWFAGLRLDLQNLGSVNFGGAHPSRPLPLGAKGSANFGVGPSFVFDSRSNMLNSRKGWFAELSWLHYGHALASDYDMEVFSADLRHYQPLNSRMVLAGQLSCNVVQGNAPFNMLSLMGNEMLMRGYYTGRFRDRHYYAAQAELRCLPFPFSHRIGGTVFLSAGEVSPKLESLSARQIKLAGGVGLRYLIFPKKDVFVRLDAGFTREGMGVYFFTGEAF
jgi:outer membrane protein assembly factor BamA